MTLPKLEQWSIKQKPSCFQAFPLAVGFFESQTVYPKENQTHVKKTTLS